MKMVMPNTPKLSKTEDEDGDAEYPAGLVLDAEYHRVAVGVGLCCHGVVEGVAHRKGRSRRF